MFKFHLINRFEAAALLGIVLSLLTADIAVFGQECDQLRGDVVRLHILANSDSAADQSLKLAVRDRILRDLGAVFETPATQADAREVAAAQLGQIEQLAAQTLAEQGVSLPVRASLCRMYFETRDYENYSLPAGVYDAVRVEIGAGEGKNWWCVMYPPICLPAAAADAQDLSDLPAMQELESLNEQPMFKPKLAVVELFEAVKEKLVE